MFLNESVVNSDVLLEDLSVLPEISFIAESFTDMANLMESVQTISYEYDMKQAKGLLSESDDTILSEAVKDVVEKLRKGLSWLGDKISKFFRKLIAFFQDKYKKVKAWMSKKKGSKEEETSADPDGTGPKKNTSAGPKKFKIVKMTDVLTTTAAMKAYITRFEKIATNATDSPSKEGINKIKSLEKKYKTEFQADTEVTASEFDGMAKEFEGVLKGAIDMATESQKSSEKILRTLEKTLLGKSFKAAGDDELRSVIVVLSNTCQTAINGYIADCSKISNVITRELAKARIDRADAD